jgi:hypothetical protein
VYTDSHPQGQISHEQTPNSSHGSQQKAEVSHITAELTEELSVEAALMLDQVE